MIVKGTVDPEPVRKALEAEGLHPVLCRIKGEEKPRALASIWVNELHDSVCGAYHEYVISFDVHTSRKDVVAFTPGLSPAPYACWYNNFGDSVCEAQFLHSLYINSPLSIAWGREMQAFPKHPEPVQSVISFGKNEKTQSCEIKWGQDTLLRIDTKRQFGIGGFLKEGAGLMIRLGPVAVMKFLASPIFRNHIIMPKQTADQSGCPANYTAYIWKGLQPMGVKLWPWNPNTDAITLSDLVKDTGSEANNGIALLKQASFTPLSVCFIDKVSAVVALRNGR